MSKLDLLYEDEHLLVINKAEGLIVHSGHGTDGQETLASILEKDYLPTGQNWPQDIIEEKRCGIVHRLDKGTSGAMVCAKTPEVHAQLSALIKDRKVDRFYWGIVKGNPQLLRQERPRLLNRLLQNGAAALKFSESYMTLASYHQRNPKKPVCFFAPMEGTRKAITNMRLLSKNTELSLMEFKLQTGRTHQIRMHMNLCQCPLLGDNMYGGTNSERMFLHSHFLRFQHPVTHEVISVDAKSETFENFCLSQSLELNPENRWPN